MSDSNGTPASSSAGRHRALTGIALLLMIGGLVLLAIGVGTIFDYLFAQSHPVGVLDAVMLRIEYTLAGIVLLLAGHRLR